MAGKPSPQPHYHLARINQPWTLTRRYAAFGENGSIIPRPPGRGGSVSLRCVGLGHEGIEGKECNCQHHRGGASALCGLDLAGFAQCIELTR
jgi:hypothetical protein